MVCLFDRSGFSTPPHFYLMLWGLQRQNFTTGPCLVWALLSCLHRELHLPVNEILLKFPGQSISSVLHPWLITASYSHRQAPSTRELSVQQLWIVHWLRSPLQLPSPPRPASEGPYITRASPRNLRKGSSKLCAFIFPSIIMFLPLWESGQETFLLILPSIITSLEEPIFLFLLHSGSNFCFFIPFVCFFWRP